MCDSICSTEISHVLSQQSYWLNFIPRTLFIKTSKMVLLNTAEVWGFQSDVYEVHCFLGRDVIQSGSSLPTFLRTYYLHLRGRRAQWMLPLCMAYSSTLFLWNTGKLLSNCVITNKKTVNFKSFLGCHCYLNAWKQKVNILVQHVISDANVRWNFGFPKIINFTKKALLWPVICLPSWDLWRGT
jgi:hypothetical protein